MSRRILIGLCGVLSCLPLWAESPELLLKAFESHCVKCHGENGKTKGKVNLLEFTSPAALLEDADLLNTLIDVIDFNEMPPEDEPPLSPEARSGVLKALKHLRIQLNAGPVAPARTPIRRMNRFQYNNAVVDLFDLQCTVFTLPERMMREHRGYFKPETGKMAETVSVGSRPLGKSQLIEPRLNGVAAFPQDLRAEHGFDNRADHLSLSPLLMESFLKLGQSITESPDFGPKNVGIWGAFFESPEEQEDQQQAIRQRIKPFLFRAFRRPIEPALLRRYTEFAQEQIKSGASFTAAMKAVAAAVLASPRFLYHFDQITETPTPDEVDDFELASRLAFFLWGSIPDLELLESAAASELKSPDVLDAHFDRMLKDHKLKRFCDSFPSQWLQLERIISSVPNEEKYPDFYFLKYRDSMHMMLEPLLLFETVLIENLPITQFLHSDFTYRSVLLQEAYGELSNLPESPKQKGNAVGALSFHRYPVKDPRNGGLITNAAVMTMTSGPERTQPITRGAWIAGVIFNNPPEPPPADVPPLGEKPSQGEEHLTLRERLSLHRERSDCRGCHEQIDPLGFALENYDPIGNWRQQYENGREVDPSGFLFRKHAFHDIEEFKESILLEKDRFTRGFAGHLLSFALARALTPQDQIALDQITADTIESEYRIQDLLRQIVHSTPFQQKATRRLPDQASNAN